MPCGDRRGSECRGAGVGESPRRRVLGARNPADRQDPRNFRQQRYRLPISVRTARDSESGGDGLRYWQWSPPTSAGPEVVVDGITGRWSTTVAADPATFEAGLADAVNEIIGTPDIAARYGRTWAHGRRSRLSEGIVGVDPGPGDICPTLAGNAFNSSPRVAAHLTDAQVVLCINDPGRCRRSRFQRSWDPRVAGVRAAAPIRLTERFYCSHILLIDPTLAGKPWRRYPTVMDVVVDHSGCLHQA